MHQAAPADKPTPLDSVQGNMMDYADILTIFFL
jgi:hypothetical protein